MSSARTIIFLLLVLWLSVETSTAQDDIKGIYKENVERRNAFSVGVFLPQAIAISYARKLANGKEITITPMFRPAAANIADEPADDRMRTNHRLFSLVDDPQWYYNHYILRTGYRIPLGDKFGYEPTLQLAYGAFFNKVIETEDSHGDAYDLYLRLDRRYFSAGIVNMVNWVKDYDRVRTKFFVGVGTHWKQIHDMQWERYMWYRPLSNFQAHEETRDKFVFSFHIGVEIGFRY